MTEIQSNKLTGTLLIDTAMGNFLGDRRIRRLEAIEQIGSISRATWDAVDDMNNVAPGLTAFGRRLIGFYRALEKESQSALEKLTRNQFSGPVETLKQCVVDVEVRIRLGLAVGQPVTAVFKEPSVFLVAMD